MTFSFVLSCHESVNPIVHSHWVVICFAPLAIDCTTRRSRRQRRSMNAGYALLSDTNTPTFHPRQLTARDQTYNLRHGVEFRFSQRLQPCHELNQVESLSLRRMYQGDEIEGPPKKAKCHEADRGIRLGDLVCRPGWLTSKQGDESISAASVTGTTPNSSREASPVDRAKISAILEEASSINFAKAVRCVPPTPSYRMQGQSTQINADKKNLLSLDVTTHARRERPAAYPIHSRNKGLDNSLMPPPPPRRGL
jgi:hypothetical protein